MKSDKFLLCFGAQRGGTTWLSKQLWNHPAFSFPHRKEIRYFDTLYYHDFNNVQITRFNEFKKIIKDLLDNPKSIENPNYKKSLEWNAKYFLVNKNNYNDLWYESLFNETDHQKWTGDFSPDYSLLPEQGVQHLYKILPDAKLIFMLRDPVDRVWSGSTYAYRYNKNASPEEINLLVKNTTKSKLQRDFSNYKEIFEKFLRFYKKDQLLVCFHDDIKHNPEKILSSICEFLNISYNIEDFPNLQVDINRSPFVPANEVLLSEISQDYLETLKWLSDEFGGHAQKWLEQAELRVSKIS